MSSVRGISAAISLALAHTPVYSQTVPHAVVAPINSTEVVSLASELELDATQSNLVFAAHARYQQMWEEQFAEQYAELWRLRGRVMQMGGQTEPLVDGHAAVTILQEFLRRCDALEPQIRAMNQALWDEMRMALGEPQKQLLDRAQLKHARSEVHLGQEAIRERQIDLIEMLSPHLQPGEDGVPGQQRDPPTPANAESKGVMELFLNDDEKSAVNAILLEWERSRVERLKSLHAAEVRSALLKAEATDIFRVLPGSALSPQEKELLSNRSNGLQAQAAKLDLPPSERLVQLNRSTLARIKDVLPPAKAQRVEALYFDEAYPEVHPDHASASGLYDLAESFDDLTVDQRALLAALRAAFQQEHDRLSARMRESVFRRGQAQFARGANYTVAVFAEWDKQMQLGRERERLNQAQKAKIQSILLPEQAARLPEWDFEKKPPRRPWLRRGSEK